MEQKIIQITSGRGPAECAWVVAQLLKKMHAAFKENGIDHVEISRSKGQENGTLNSVSLLIKGVRLNAFLAEWCGSVLWIGQSPYRKFHKRKNWFVGIEGFNVDRETKMDTRMIKFQTMRSSGPGGQHVNKVESAVRATHIPTGISVVARASRSQHMNKKIALEKLKKEIETRKHEQLSEKSSHQWDSHNKLLRGSPVRTYSGKEFRLKKK